MSSKPAYTARTVSASAPAAANAERLGLPHVVRLGHTLQIVKLAARDSNVCLNDSARLTLRPDFRTGQSRLLVSMGEVDLLAGRAEEARRFADLVLARAREHRQRGDEALSTELVCMRWATADATLGARADLLPAWPGKARTLQHEAGVPAVLLLPEEEQGRHDGSYWQPGRSRRAMYEEAN